MDTVFLSPCDSATTASRFYAYISINAFNDLTSVNVLCRVYYAAETMNKEQDVTRGVMEPSLTMETISQREQ